MKKRRLFAQTLALLLCFALLCPLTAFAEDTNSAIPADPASYAVIDPVELQRLVEAYAAARSLNKDNISVGYCYLDTGDTWYYNGDAWNFGAGVYYVPLMMILAERESRGELTQTSNLNGLTLEEAERYVLTYSNNAYAHQMMNYIGTDKEVRKLYQNYSSLPEAYYDPDFLDYSYFTVRFLTDVMKTLYNDSERFPNIIECMKNSDNGSVFHGAMNGEYEVAQKYGNYIDRRDVAYNNTIGIIYTPHPFVLTVMTKNLGITHEVMWDLAVIFKDYTLSLDDAYAVYEARQNGPVVPETPAAEAVTPVAPGAESPADPAAAQEPAALAPEGGQIPVEIPSSTAQTPADGQEDPAASRRRGVLILCAAALVILTLAAILKPTLRKKQVREKKDKLKY